MSDQPVRYELRDRISTITIDRPEARNALNRAVPLDRLQEEARALAMRIAQNAPLSVRAGKRMVYATAERLRSESFDEAERIFEPVYKSEDAQEGPRAFLEKRAPVWRKR